MVSKFGFGGIGHKVRVGKLAGQQDRVWGERLIAPALFEEGTDYVYEFGEIVEIVNDTRTNYIVKPVDANTTADAPLGVIMEEITGARDIKQGVVRNGISNIALNIWVLGSNQGSITVALQGETSPVIGEPVFLGLGTGTTLAGAVYSVADGVNTIELPYIFKSEEWEPTSTKAKTVAIGKVL